MMRSSEPKSNLKETHVSRSPSIDASGSADTRRRSIALYAAAVFFYWSALYLYVPTLPTYAAGKTDRLALVGVVLSMYGLWQAVIRLPLGILADWLGRRRHLIVAGFALTSLGALVMASATGIAGLAIGRAITGLSAGTWVLLVVAFSGLFPPDESVRATALLTLVGSLGRMLATGANGPLNELGGYSLAFYLAAASGVAAIACILFTREARRPSVQPAVSRLKGLLLQPDVLVPSLLALVAQYANWASTFGFTPILAEELGATDTLLSIMISLNVAVIMLANLGTATFSKHLANKTLAVAGFASLTVGLVSVAWAPTLPLLFAGQFCVGLSMGILAPTLMGLSIRTIPEEQRSTAMGFHQAVYAIGMFAGPWLSGILGDVVGIRPTFVVTGLVALGLGLLGTRLLNNGLESAPGTAPAAVDSSSSIR
jgi:predicted MFS family arabinose efflux permease